MAKKGKNKKSTTPAPVLIKVLAVDFFVRYWMVTALAFLLVFSAMMLSQTNHQSRRYTAEFQAEKKRQRDLQIQWDSLRLELTTLTEADRISSEAKKRLDMEEVTIKNEKVISL